jgi:phospholipase C
MAIFITWDDWGGIYDHVEPPVVERDNHGRPLRFGHRVPCLVISPHARRGFVYHEPRSFLSLLRFAFEVLHVPLPPGRINTEGSMWDCFAAGQAPMAPVAFQHRECAPPRPG